MSVFAGGATGIFGSFLGKVFGFLESYEKRKARREEMAHELNLFNLQQDARSSEAAYEREMMDMQTAADLRISSYDHDTRTGNASQWIVDILRLIRPVLTLLLLIGVGVVWFTLPQWDMLKKTLVEFLVYAAMISITWWFGDRAVRIAPR
ncbi:MAG: hypothetical protein ACTSXQ_01405 [Alphaproteobacteria bacterium]